MRPMTFLRVLATGVAAGMVWRLAMRAVFGPAQSILTNRAEQSAKMLNAFLLEPVPRSSQQPAVLWMGLICIGVVWASVYAGLMSRSAAPWWRKGLVFWIVSWALMVPWFEFYLPWNVMLEPMRLVGVELLCWAVVLLMVAMTIAAVNHCLGQLGKSARSSG
jgi:hypothetical protein